MANYQLTKRTIKDKDGNVKRVERCIIANFDKMTANEREAVEMYMKAGYKVYPSKMKKTTGKGLTTEKMEKYLKENDEEGLKELKDRRKKKENFMTTTKWFKEKYPEAVEKLKSK